ncbi:hypothetical protein PFISCL1PPCAC_7740 [Pristionchus fissidentatus]|uniref:Sulfotransferase domain-containing protein n=1 Tax=Pristionchus fissidentatus TaxID=1538716 RepID=A0AAV5VB32_9BILA|nr:hypothetical protein PFISCL1PPCAC_7740 [Pristionchus fissidentatus]
MMARCGRVAVLATGVLCSLALLALLQIFSFELSPEAGLTSTQPLTIERRAMSAPSEESRSPQHHLPSALLIGVRKGGTRALLDALALHPAIKAARREVHYFDDETNYAKGEEWYLERMPLSRSGEFTIEKTPAYFTNPTVPERVYRLNPSMKIILIVREPVTRAISDFTQVYYNRLELNKSLPVFEDLVFTRDGKIDETYKPLRNSLYSTHLKRWLRYFPLNQILILDGDQFVKDPLSQLRLAEDFLQLRHEIRSDQLIFNPAKGFHCFRKTYSSKVKCLGRSKGRMHRQIDERTQHQLGKLLRPHNKAFYRMINRVFDW